MNKNPKSPRAKLYFFISVLGILYAGYLNGDLRRTAQNVGYDLFSDTPSLTSSYFLYDNKDVSNDNALSQNAPEISLRAENHILYGDSTGGGHKYGTGKPCKSEFPKNWESKKIISTIRKLVANDNLNWEQQNNGYYVAETEEGSLNIRIVMNKEKGEVVTAYPTNTPRNPCDTYKKSPSNDNYND